MIPSLAAASAAVHASSTLTHSIAHPISRASFAALALPNTAVASLAPSPSVPVAISISAASESSFTGSSTANRAGFPTARPLDRRRFVARFVDFSSARSTATRAWSYASDFPRGGAAASSAPAARATTRRATPRRRPSRAGATPGATRGVVARMPLTRDADDRSRRRDAACSRAARPRRARRREGPRRDRARRRRRDGRGRRARGRPRMMIRRDRRWTTDA